MDEVPPEYLSDEEACALIGAPKPQKPGNENGAKNRSPASPRGASARLIVFGRAGLAAQLGREPLSLFGRDTSTPEVLDGFPKTGAQAEFLRRLNCLRTCTGYPTSAGRLTCGHLASFRRTAVFDGLGDAASVASAVSVVGRACPRLQVADAVVETRVSSRRQALGIFETQAEAPQFSPEKSTTT